MDGPIVVNFDGGSRGNPGAAGVGVVLSAIDGTPLVTLGRYIGIATNNVAEYQAVILGLQKALEVQVQQVIVRGDSELIIKQLNGVYRVKQPHLIPLWREAKALLGKFKSAKLEHNLRHKNVLADKLANLAMDRRRDVTDDDMPSGGNGSDRIAGTSNDDSPAHMPSPEASRPAGAPRIGDAFSCRRCGTIVEIVKPGSVAPDALHDFVCQCGAKMHRHA